MPSDQRVHLQIYGIKNCDSCRHAMKWLDIRNVPYTFHDIRTEELPQALLEQWLASEYAPYLVNKRSTTWRRLSDEEKLQAQSHPMPLLLAHPTLMKRPVITDGESILDVGFAPSHMEDYI
jgi:arsenate reductase